MMIIACDNITMETTAVAMRGEEPYSAKVMELPYERSLAMKTNMDNIGIQSGNIQSTKDGADEDILRREVRMDRCGV